MAAVQDRGGDRLIEELNLKQAEHEKERVAPTTPRADGVWLGVCVRKREPDPTNALSGSVSGGANCWVRNARADGAGRRQRERVAARMKSTTVMVELSSLIAAIPGASHRLRV